MPTLYVTEPRSVVRRSVGSVVVTLNEDPDGPGPLPERQRRLLEVEPHRLELIALVGRVHITADALQLCLEQGIAVAWLRANGNFMGRLVPELSRTADLRLAQFRMADDEPQALALAQTFVAAKLHNAVGLLTALRSNRRSQPALGRAIGELRAMADTVAQATSREVLLGYEGDAARRYFAGLRLGFTGAIGFAAALVGHRRTRPMPCCRSAMCCWLMYWRAYWRLAASIPISALCTRSVLGGRVWHSTFWRNCGIRSWIALCCGCAIGDNCVPSILRLMPSGAVCASPVQVCEFSFALGKPLWTLRCRGLAKRWHQKNCFAVRLIV